MTEQKKILKRSDILRTMADRATDKFGMMIALSFGICVPFVVMLFAANWIWCDVTASSDLCLASSRAVPFLFCWQED